MRSVRGLVAAACLFAFTAMAAESPVTIAIERNPAAKAVPSDFAGLSFETLLAMPEKDGSYFFSHTNKPLIHLFKTLGIRNLRIGGNTADLPKFTIPTHKDIDTLFGFARAAGVKIIYTLRLRNGDVSNDVAVAQYIETHYRKDLSSFAIGNEPDYYRKVYPVITNYTSFRDQWQKFAEAVVAGVPNAPLCGPSAGEKADWAREFANDFGASLHPMVTQHDYPGGPARRTTNAAVARDKMLSTTWLDYYTSNYNAFATTALSNGLPYRLEEANNFSDGGVRNASDTFAAALWVLDYFHWWAAHGAAGINIHGRRWVPNCLMTNRAGAYELRPIAYGIAAFAMGCRGEPDAVSISNPDALKLTAYAIRDGSTEYLTLINKEHGAQGRAAAVSFAGARSPQKFAALFLTAPDVAAQSGMALGGVEIDGKGNWRGKWSTEHANEAGKILIKVLPASAVIVRFPAVP